MPDDQKALTELQEKVKRLETLVQRVPALCGQCLREGTLTLGVPHSAAREFLKLIRRIEKEMC
jgi:hypothetical protein